MKHRKIRKSYQQSKSTKILAQNISADGNVANQNSNSVQSVGSGKITVDVDVVDIPKTARIHMNSNSNLHQCSNSVTNESIEGQSKEVTGKGSKSHRKVI